MSQEPEKKIEKQLREHAETRRTAAHGQTELHPATRALLQGEVTRTYGTQPVPQERAQKPWWAYWPGLLFASCCVLLLAIFTIRPGRENIADLAQTAEPSSSPVAGMAPVSTQPPPDSFEMAAVPQVETATDRLVLQPQDPVPQTTGAFAAENKLEAQKELLGSSAVASRARIAKADEPANASMPAPSRPQAVSSPPPAVALPSGTLRSTSRPVTVNAESEGISRPAPAPAEMTTAPAATPAPALAASTLDLRDAAEPTAKAKIAAAAPTSDTSLNLANPVAGQLFEQTPPRSGMRRNFQSPASPEVLEQFRVQQNGAELRFVDSDGSVYVGNVITAEKKAMAVKFGAQQAKDADEERNAGAVAKQLNEAISSRGVMTEAEGAYFFRATGMNRSLNQPVVIDGTFRNSLPAEPNSNRLDAAKKAQEQTTNTLQLLIQGRATVGDRQELIINAVPVNR